MPSMLAGRGWLGEGGGNRGSGTGSVGRRVVSSCIVCVSVVFFPCFSLSLPFPFYYINITVIIIIIIYHYHFIVIIKLCLSQPTSSFARPILFPIPQGWGGVSERLWGVQLPAEAEPRHRHTFLSGSCTDSDGQIPTPHWRESP